jgi:hypothetical protein
LGMADVFVSNRISQPVYLSLFTLYAIDIMFHNYSEFSTLGGLIAFVIFLIAYLLQFKKNFQKLFILIVPLTLLSLAIFIAPSTMTVAFLYFSINISLIILTKKNFSYFFRPTLIAIYLFAGLNKMSPAFISGGILKIYLPDVLESFAKPLAFLALFTELTIALLLFLNWKGARWLVLFFHLGIQFFIPIDILHFYSLFLYGSAMTLSAFLLFDKSRA